MRITAVLTLILLLMSCGGEAPPPSTPEAGMTPEAAMKMAQEQAKVVQARHNRETLDKETVKAMLPAELLGLPRVSQSANAMKMGGFDMTTADATYDDKERRIKVTIADGVGLQTMGMAGQMAAFEMDSEEGDQHKYTLKVDGKKAIIDYNKRSRRGSLTVIYSQSTVTIDASQVDGESDLKKIYNKLELGKL